MSRRFLFAGDLGEICHGGIQLTKVANQLSAGELDVQLPGLRTRDEIQDFETSLAGVTGEPKEST